MQSPLSICASWLILAFLLRSTSSQRYYSPASPAYPKTPDNPDSPGPDSPPATPDSPTSDGNDFSIPADLAYSLGFPSATVTYGASNIQIELYSLVEGDDHITVTVQLAVGNQTVCSQSFLEGSSQHSAQLSNSGSNAGCASSAIGLGLLLDDSGFAEGLLPSRASILCNDGKCNAGVFSAKAVPIVGALLMVGENEAAQFRFTLHKSYPGTQLLPQDAASAAYKPIKAFALTQNTSFVTKRLLSSAPGSGLWDAVLNELSNEKRGDGDSGIDVQIALKSSATADGRQAKLGVTVTNNNLFGYDQPRPLLLRVLLWDEGNWSSTPESAFTPLPALVLDTSPDQPYLTLTAVPGPGNAFTFYIMLDIPASAGCYPLTASGCVQHSDLAQICRDDAIDNQPPNTCTVMVKASDGSRWTEFPVDPDAVSPETVKLLTDSLITSPTQLVTSPQQALSIAQQLDAIIQKGNDQLLGPVYQSYVVVMGKVYTTDQGVVAFGNFNANLKFVAQHNLLLDVNTEYRRRRSLLGLAPGAGRELAQVQDNQKPTTTFWVGVNSYSDIGQDTYSTTVLMPNVTVPPRRGTSGTNGGTTTGGTGRSPRPPRPPPRSGRGLLKAKKKGKSKGSKAKKHKKVKGSTSLPMEGGLPLQLDWRSAMRDPALGERLPQAKHQFRCASAWANAAMAALEASLLMAYPNVPRSEAVLSRQQVIDCARPQYLGANYTSEGCSGGWPLDLFEFAFEQGLVMERDYDYNGTSATFPCPSAALLGRSAYSYTYKDVVIAGDPGSIVAFEGSSALDLITALQTGPIVVMMDGSDNAFKQYSGGIYVGTDCSTNALTHAVLLVGYVNNGTSTYPDGYWIVRNSLGYQWGDLGDAKIRMTPEGTPGTCGMYRYAFAPPRTFSVVPSSFTTPPPPIAPPEPVTYPDAPAPPHAPYTTICLGGSRSDWCLQVCTPSNPACAQFVDQTGGALPVLWASTAGVQHSRSDFLSIPQSQATTNDLTGVSFQHVQTGLCLTILDQLGFKSQTSTKDQTSWPLGLMPCLVTDSATGTTNSDNQVFQRKQFPLDTTRSLLYSFNTFDNHCLDGCSDSNILLDRAAVGYAQCNRFTPDSYDNSQFSAAYMSRCWATGDESVPSSWLDFELLSINDYGSRLWR